MEDLRLHKDLQLRSGEQSIQALIDRLTELNKIDPSFATAATVDAMRALEELLRRHINIDDETVDICCSAFIAALTNAATTSRAQLVACNPDEQIVDYTTEEFLR